MKIVQVEAIKKIAQDAPGAIFSRGVATWVPPVSSTRIATSILRRSICLKLFDRTKTMWTLASLWTQRTRPQGSWKSAKSALFHSAHIDHLFLQEEDKKTRNERRKPLSPTVHEIGSGPRDFAVGDDAADVDAQPSIRLRRSRLIARPLDGQDRKPLAARSHISGTLRRVAGSVLRASRLCPAASYCEDPAETSAARASRWFVERSL